MSGSIGKDVIRTPNFLCYKTPNPLTEIYQQRIIQVLKTSEIPLNIEQIRKAASIGSWITARSHVMILIAEGKVEKANKQKLTQYYRLHSQSQPSSTLLEAAADDVSSVKSGES